MPGSESVSDREETDSESDSDLASSTIDESWKDDPFYNFHLIPVSMRDRRMGKRRRDNGGGVGDGVCGMFEVFCSCILVICVCPFLYRYYMCIKYEK